MDLSEVEKFEEAKVVTIKLSEAMRIGAKMHPQGMSYFDREEGTTCALGAAAFGAGWQQSSDEGMCSFLKRTFDIPLWAELQIHGMNVMRHKPEGTYAAIADWLEAQGL